MEDGSPVVKETPSPADDVSSKINSALSSLDGDDNAPITETLKVTPKVEPPTPPATPKPPEDVAKEKAPEPPADAAVAKPDTEATPKETPEKPLLAGKYTNKYDLQAGVL
jgi:cell division protein FtsN